jgi:hypothetical protein
LLNWGKSTFTNITYLLKRRFTSSLSVDEQRGETFYWLLSWCNKYLPQTPHVTAISRYDESLLGPAPGKYLIRYAGKRLLLERDSYTASTGNGATGQLLVRLTLQMLGRDRAFWDTILAEGKRLYTPTDNSILVSTQSGTNWGYCERQLPRPLDTVILDADIKQTLQHDIGEFLASEQWYAERGISWRRGYIFYGPPGGGKSSLIKALAGHWALPLYILNLGDPDLTDATLSGLINSLRHCIIVLEDVDTVLPGREVAGDTQRGLTYSGVLNAIDGVSSGHGTLLIMTANHPECLDPALIRPGRVDVRVLIDNPSGPLVKEIFNRFYPATSFPQASELATKLATLFTERRLSMATIQGELMRERHNPVRAFEALSAVYENPPPVTLPPVRVAGKSTNTGPQPTVPANVVAPSRRLLQSSPRPR